MERKAMINETYLTKSQLELIVCTVCGQPKPTEFIFYDKKNQVSVLVCRHCFDDSNETFLIRWTP